ncbi:MAG: S8 family serine peptidase [Ardenticatenaceae bacterium]|nr:S8 family serine peptidase [Ardenticatenaceae bacterium]
MKQRLVILLLATLAPLTLLAVFLLWSPTAVFATTTKYDPTLAQSPNPVSVIIYLQQQADLPPQRSGSRLAQRVAVVEGLQQTAVSSQTPLRNLLTRQQQAGLVADIHPFWIVNAIAATVDPAALPAIAALSSVSHILPDVAFDGFAPPANAPEPAVPVTETAVLPTWGVERIGAPLVWDGLGVRGEGVVVAIMDSGVDWNHPQLRPTYRGLNPNGTVDHRASWYSPGNPLLRQPTDVVGHGTHVAGTAVGQSGIGVAPAARWIAVNIANPDGLILTSAVHAGFEWLLAPGGDPSLAPDIVNGSWSGAGNLDLFLPDLAALRAGGILPVFASGNNGPFPETIGAPASYPTTLAVGASDDIDALAWFSSRGPSFFTPEPKPQLVAPGTAVFSTFPDNQYRTFLGTSMAAPHVSGAAALLLSANPALSPDDLTRVLLQTAVAITTTHPNFDSGWGRLDVYAAVASQLATGRLRGTVRGNGLPLPNVPLTLTTPSGAALPFASDDSGQFELSLVAGGYTVAAAPFGYAPAQTSVTVQLGQTAVADLNATPLPGGTVQGQIRSGGQPLTATVQVVGLPVAVRTDENGRYALTLPSGSYQLAVHAHGHELGKASLTLAVGQVLTRNFDLAAAPTVLLIDSGQWYYQSYARYYDEALLAAGFDHDTATIRNPFADVPTLEQVQPYDVVIWSAPHDAPGRVAANDVITDYLKTGGNLLISGENVAYYDGQGFGTQPWFFRNLGALFDGEQEGETAVSSLPATPFAGMTLALNGGDSANNQATPDNSRLRENVLTRPVLRYTDGHTAGLLAGHCAPYQLIYLGFGLEGVRRADDRAELLRRSFAHFADPLVQQGLQLTPGRVDDFAIAGDELVYTITVRNLSEAVTETVDILLSGGSWPTTLLTPTLTLGPCQMGETVLRLAVPPDVGRDVVHEMVLTAVSRQNPGNRIELPVRHKTPGRFLLVDDDRWFDQQRTFLAALAGNGIVPDVWEIGGSPAVRGSPTLHLLAQYDYVFWFTGYDWFAPVTRAENELLTEYLAQNGRLFLNSQDYLYYNLHTPLTLNYFGIISQSESITPTAVYPDGSLGLPPALAGLLPLDYKAVGYQNFSDGLILAPGTMTFLWHNQGTPAGVARKGDGWRAVFWDVPLEVLPPAEQPAMMGSVVGWLSNWGDAIFVVDSQTGVPGEPRTYTLTLPSVAPTRTLRLTNTLPTGLMLLPATLDGGAVYDAATNQLTWQGVVSGSHQIRYQAVPQATAAPLVSTVQLADDVDGIVLTRTAAVWLDAPDLREVALTAVSATATPSPALTYTLVVSNSGLAAANAQIELRLPDAASPITDTLHSSDGTTTLKQHRVNWQVAVAPGDTVTTTIVLTYTPRVDVWLAGTAVVDDGVTQPVIKHLQLYLPPYQYYFPFSVRHKPL